MPQQTERETDLMQAQDFTLHMFDLVTLQRELADTLYPRVRNGYERIPAEELLPLLDKIVCGHPLILRTLSDENTFLQRLIDAERDKRDGVK